MRAFVASTCPVASPAALILMKNTYRPQDRIDHEYLEALIRRRG